MFSKDFVPVRHKLVCVSINILGKGRQAFFFNTPVNDKGEAKVSLDDINECVRKSGVKSEEVFSIGH